LVRGWAKQRGRGVGGVERGQRRNWREGHWGESKGLEAEVPRKRVKVVSYCISLRT